MHIHTKHTHASKPVAICCCFLNSDQIWNLRFCPPHFFLSALLLPPLDIKLTRILHGVRKIFSNPHSFRNPSSEILLVCGLMGLKKIVQSGFKLKLEQIKAQKSASPPSSHTKLLLLSIFTILSTKKHSYDHSCTKLLITYWFCYRTQFHRMTFRTLTLAFGWNIMLRWTVWNIV